MVWYTVTTMKKDSREPPNYSATGVTLKKKVQLVI